MDLGVVANQLTRWKAQLPRVDPWFAVKCCPDPGVMATLAKGGCGFDVASAGEMQAAVALCGAERIIYANPCKQPSHVRAARDLNIALTTFDNVEELRKVHGIYPQAQFVVRILGDDSSSVCQFNVKFGVAVEELEPILLEARALGANVVGVSFHVGSGCQSADAFVSAVENARVAFDLFEQCGLPAPKFLDLGGGWPGDLEGDKPVVSFEQIAVKLAPALDRLFAPDVQIIAEPGRYFVHAAGTLAVCVSAKRSIFVPELLDAQSDSEDGPKRQRLMQAGFRYYVNDGVYGSFNCIMFDHRENLRPVVLLTQAGEVLPQGDSMCDCSVFGSTCDGIDRITASCPLPDVPIGTWFVYDNMGAYTTAAASTFNGFEVPRTFYV